MQRFTSPLAIGGALLAAAMLAACGGGSSSSPGTLPSTSGGANTQSQKPGAHVTVVINRAPAPVRMVRIGKTTKRRQYISQAAEGLQISVALTASTSAPQMVYADISQSSPLCTTSGTLEPLETCIIAIPTLGASETISATELDQTPTGDTSGGYGTGFGTGSNILAVGSTTASITLGSATNNVALGLDPVAANLADGAPTTSGMNFAEDNGMRLVMTGGEVLPAQGLAVFGLDAANPTPQNIQGDSVPEPYVDVNGSPVPVTISVSPATAGVNIDTIPTPAPQPLPSFGPTASIPNESFVWKGWEWVVGIEGSTAFTSPATITVANNLTALNPFTGDSYSDVLTYTIDPVTVSPVSATLSISTNPSTIVTGTDAGTTMGMGAESAYQAHDGACLDTSNSSQIDANVTTGTFQAPNQPFTVTAVATGMCTFVLYDLDTDVVTQTVTVNVGT